MTEITVSQEQSSVPIEVSVTQEVLDSEKQAILSRRVGQTMLAADGTVMLPSEVADARSRGYNRSLPGTDYEGE